MTCRLTMDDASYDAGYLAGLVASTSRPSPYPAGTVESWSWHAGFIDGRAAQTRQTRPRTRLTLVEVGQTHRPA